MHDVPSPTALWGPGFEPPVKAVFDVIKYFRLRVVFKTIKSHKHIAVLDDISRLRFL